MYISLQVHDCVSAGKHVLAEKPLHGFRQAFADEARFAQLAGGGNAATHFQVAFHRRHDPEFQRARAHIQAIIAGAPKAAAAAKAAAPPQCSGCDAQCPSADDEPFLDVLITSADPVPPDANLPNVVRNSIVHDLDCALWLLSAGGASDSAGDSASDSASGGAGGAGLVLVLESASVPDFASSAVRLELQSAAGWMGGALRARVHIDYRKRSGTYTQTVVVKQGGGGGGGGGGVGGGGGGGSSAQFGYVWDPPGGAGSGEWPCGWACSGPAMAQLWRGAYAAQYASFAEACARAEALQERLGAGVEVEGAGAEGAEGAAAEGRAAVAAEGARWAAQQARLVGSYFRTFDLMEQCAQAVGAAVDDEDKRCEFGG